MSITVQSIFRYPVKGLSAKALDRVQLTTGQCIPHDRRFAIAHAATHIDPENPQWLPKTKFFMLMRDEKLAELHTCFDEHSKILTVEHRGEVVLNSNVSSEQGRAEIDEFFSRCLSDCPGGPPKFVEAPGHTFSDAKQKPNSTTYKYISLVNLASVGELERRAQTPIDPARFRANVYLEGAGAWSEFDWIGSEFRLGEARLKAIAPTTRCPATAVNPATAERDLDIPRILLKEFEHNYMGVYAEVVEDGAVETNDLLVPL